TIIAEIVLQQGSWWGRIIIILRFMIEFRRKFIYGAVVLVIALSATLMVTNVHAVAYVPVSLHGNLSYSYGYANTGRSESENSSISVGIEMAAYIWQPWFITNTWGVSLGTAKTVSGSNGGGSSKFISGRFAFNVFPQSRVPFSLSYSRGNSLSENGPSSNRITTNEFITSRLLIRQAYIGGQGLYANFTWSHIESESSTSSDSSSDNVNLNFRKRIPKQTFNGNLAYSTNETSGSNSKPQRLSLNGSHSYNPGTNVTFNSSAGANKNTLSGDITGNSTSVQVGSFFSWRPQYKSLNVSGGARLSSSESESGNTVDSNTFTSSSRNFGLNVGANYQLTTRVRLSGNVALTLADETNTQTTSSSVIGALTYTSEQYSLVGFNYSFGTNAAIGSSANDTDGSARIKNQSGSVGANHRASRTWNVGRASSLNFGVSQGGSVFGSANSTDNSSTSSISHSVNVGISTRGRSGTTFVAATLSDSRTFSEVESEFQQVSVSASRSHTISRMSSLNGTAALQTSRQAGDTLISSSTGSARVTARYRAARFFNIYGMPFTSSIIYSVPMTDGVVGDDIFDWDNDLDYRIGLLNMALTVRMKKSGNRDPTYSAFFRATRTF
ncbi:MAG: hypothetical protein ACC707_05915, partial [Thiohalomonadales bacterium]